MSQPFITYREDDQTGVHYYILQKAFPNYVGRIQNVADLDSICCISIPGYSLHINFAGRIDGNFIPNHKGALEDINNIFVQMAEWYLKERINKQMDRYSKFKSIKR